MRTLILFILDWIRQRLDPDYATELERYRARVREQQELIERESQALQAATYKLVQLQCQRDQVAGQIEAVKAEIVDLERRREEVRSDREKKLDDLARVSDDELRRRPV